MPRRVNFADPDYEPSDEDLAELMHEAFAGVAEAHQQSLVDMEARIKEAQREMRAKARARFGASKSE